MATLWDRFQQAVEWLDTAATALAGIRTIPGAELGNFDDIVAATSSTTAAPTLGTDGIDIEGHRTIDLGFIFSVAAESVEIRMYLYNKAGDQWFAGESNKTVQALAGDLAVFVEPFDCESFDRVDVRIITAPTSGTVQIVGSPNNE